MRAHYTWWVFVYERDLYNRLSSFDSYMCEKRNSSTEIFIRVNDWLDEKTKEELYDIYMKIDMGKNTDELEGYTFTNKAGEHIIIYYSSEIEKPTFEKPSNLWGVLKKTILKRRNKTFPISYDLLNEMVKTYPQFYYESLFINSNLGMFQKLKKIVDFFQNYINMEYPIIHKHSLKRKDIYCGESNMGVLRAVVHQVGFASGDENIIPLIDSGYLEIQMKPYEYNSGNFTTLTGYGDKLTYPYVVDDGIYLVFSLSVLDDFDYWVGLEMKIGSQDSYDFYKGICDHCDEKVKKYSSAERAYMVIDRSKKLSHETVFTSDINLRRYLEAIYVPDKKIYRKLKSSKDLEPWARKIITNKDNIDKVYWKNCKGEIPEKLNDKEFKKISKLVKHRKPVDEIPKINYNAINANRKLSILMENIGDYYFKQFPILSD